MKAQVRRETFALYTNIPLNVSQETKLAKSNCFKNHKPKFIKKEVILHTESQVCSYFCACP